ncbi:MAG: TldD/PmbA family protein [Anaerolineales bacterium]|nr:TldD/PmbA family protein [Anaerolineales bacterium]
MQEILQEALKRSRADYTEIRVEEKESTQVVYRGKELENASATLDRGGIVRCLVRKNGWGIATFNNLDDLFSMVDQAYECARVGQAESPIQLAEIPISQETIQVTLKRDFRGIPMDEKKSLAERYNEIVLGFDPRIIDTQTVYSDSFVRLILATSEGTYIEEERPLVTIVSAAIARQNGDVQTAIETLSGPHGFEYALDRENVMKTSAQRAIDLLNAQPVAGGQYPVVIDPMLAGVFVHEAFGHLSESDFVYENPKAQEMMVLGRRFGQDILNVFDDGSVPNQRGTHLFDDEGTPTRHNDLIKDGILVGRLHSRETAARMGEQPTGNARAVNYRHPPIVRMTNTAIGPGNTSFEEMIADIQLGVYACDAYGGQTALENFSFSSGYAYMIRDGKLAEMVKDVILAGNLFATLASIDRIGNDFRWINTAGGCGKGNQYPLPVSFGAPHIRIQNVVIGGQ